MRTFLAVAVSGAVGMEAHNLISDLARTRAKVKWVDPRNLHLTLKFFGDVDDDDVSKICTAVQQAVASQSTFHGQCQGVGAFPHVSRPRTIWVGMGRGNEQMIQLQQALDGAVATLGFPGERRSFHPHLTIGRVRGGRDLDKLSALLRQQADRVLGPLSVSTVTFFASQLHPTGPRYTVLARFALT